MGRGPSQRAQAGSGAGERAPAEPRGLLAGSPCWEPEGSTAGRAQEGLPEVGAAWLWEHRAHPVTLKQSVPCLPPLPHLPLEPHGGLALGYFTQHLASWHRAAPKCRAKQLPGTVGVRGWDSTRARIPFPGTTTRWRCMRWPLGLQGTLSTRVAVRVCRGGFPVTSTWPDQPYSLHETWGHSGWQTRGGRSPTWQPPCFVFLRPPGAALLQPTQPGHTPGWQGCCGTHS